MDLFGYEGVDSPEQEMEKIVFAMRLSSRLKMNWKGINLVMRGSNLLNTN